MPNPYYNKQVSNIKTKGGAGSVSVKGSGGAGALTEKTASWPGLPGKSGPNRANGVTKVKIYPKSEGL